MEQAQYRVMVCVNAYARSVGKADDAGEIALVRARGTLRVSASHLLDSARAPSTITTPTPTHLPHHYHTPHLPQITHNGSYCSRKENS